MGNSAEYQRRPEVRAYQRAYRQRPEVAARRRAAQRTPEVRAQRLARRRLLEATWTPERREAEIRRDNLRRLYDMTEDAFQAMLADQSGMCAICRRPERQMDRGRVRRLSVDHDHSTGAVRGLLCGSCNRALGYFSEDPVVLASAIAYLKRR